MDDLELRVVESLDGTNAGLFPHIPYLLQDLTEIGTSTEVVSAILKANDLIRTSGKRVLDIGCGKGAVSIHLAHEFGFRPHGIDAVPQFIEEAVDRSCKLGLQQKCLFEVGDIREKISGLSGYDIVVLGAIGPVVLGGLEQTLIQSSSVLKQGGYIILDDAYLPEKCDTTETVYYSKQAFFNIINKCSLNVKDAYIFNAAEIEPENSRILACIKNRATELSRKYPEKTALFSEYVLQQEKENARLEKELICSLLLLQK